MRAEKEYQGLTRYLLGRVVVVDEIDHAIALAKKYSHSLRIVTLEGESLNPGGSMSGGAFKNSGNLLGRRREMDELEKSVKEWEDKSAALNSEIEQLKKEREEIRTVVDELKGQLQEQFILENTAKIKVNEAEARKEANESGRADLKSEAAEIENQISEIRSNKEGIEASLKEAELHEGEIEEQIKAAQEELEEKTKAEQGLSEKLRDAEMSLSSMLQKEEFIRQNEERIRAELKNCEEELEKLLVDGEQALSDVEYKENQIKDLSDSIQQSEEEAKKQEANIQEMTEQREKLNEAQKTFFGTREELSNRMNFLDKETYRLNSQKEKIEDASEDQSNYMWEEYELTYNAALELKAEGLEDLNEIKRHVLTLKADIRKLGDVNVNAIEEYKEVSERYEFLNNQRNDLVEAEKTLIDIIEELDQGMRTTFTEKFEEIKVEFDKVFKALFGGGKGTLN